MKVLKVNAFVANPLDPKFLSDKSKASAVLCPDYNFVKRFEKTKNDDSKVRE